MALVIAIDELGIGNDKVAYMTLPANKNTVIDAMDREKIFDETFVRIENCDEFPELNGYEFDEEPTFGELNFLAKRLKEIACDTSGNYRCPCANHPITRLSCSEKRKIDIILLHFPSKCGILIKRDQCK